MNIFAVLKNTIGVSFILNDKLNLISFDRYNVKTTS